MISSADRRVLFLDTETFSTTNIKKAGAFKYVEDPAFEVLLLPYAWGDDPVRVLDMFDPVDRAELPKILEALRAPDVVKVAHNSAFERAAYHRAFGFYQPPEEWVDTMILAAYNGLPMSLEAAGEALGIERQKLKEGKALINYFCKPCKPTIANGGRTRNLPHHAPEKWERFKKYAGRDVEAERLIFKRLIRYPVTDFERKVWAVDACINERGVLVDLDLARAAIDVDDAFKASHTEEMALLTGMANPNSVAQLKEWLAAVGLHCDSLNKSTVADLVKTAPDRTTRRVLELRQLLGKTSTKKYEAMVNAAGADTTETRKNSDLFSWHLESSLYYTHSNHNLSAKIYWYSSGRGLPGPVIRQAGQFRNGDRQWDRNLFAQAQYSYTKPSFGVKIRGKYADDRCRYLQDTTDNQAVRFLDQHFRQREAYLSVSSFYRYGNLSVAGSWDGIFTRLDTDVPEFRPAQRFSSLVSLRAVYTSGNFSVNVIGIAAAVLLVAKAVVAQSHHVLAVNVVARLQRVFPYQQVGQRDGKVVHADGVEQMLLAESSS